MTNYLNTTRELDARYGDGLETHLLWNPGDDSVPVVMDQSRVPR
jgi:hypothetical protein